MRKPTPLAIERRENAELTRRIEHAVRTHAKISSFTDKTFNKTLYILECTVYGVFFKDASTSIEVLYANARTFYRTVLKNSR